MSDCRIGRCVILMGLLLCLGGLFCSCNESTDEQSTATSIGAFIVTTDYQTGSFTTISMDEVRELAEDIDTICSDSIARYAQNKMFIVGRYGCDSIQVRDVLNDYAVLSEYSVGAGTNPQDICVIDSEKAYISRLNSPELLVVHPVTGTVLSTIDLSSLDDGDGSPEPALMYYDEDMNYVFVAVQRLNNWVSMPPSYVVVIDTLTDSIVKSIELDGLNPFSEFAIVKDWDRLYIGCNGAYGVFDGGVEMIDLVSLESQGIKLAESQLNGDILDIEIYSRELGYVLLSDVNFNTRVLPFSPETGEIKDVLLETEGYSLITMGLNDRDELWIADRTPTAPAIHIYSAADGSFIETIALSGLPPFWMTFILGE